MTSIDNQRAQKKDDYKVIHKPSSTYGFINPEVIRNYDQQQTEYSLTDENVSRTQFIFVNKNINNRSSLKTVLDDIPEYTAWSFFNLIFCSFILGIWAMIMSFKTKQIKSKNDLENAKASSQMTAILNIFATIFGCIVIIIYILRYFS